MKILITLYFLPLISITSIIWAQEESSAIITNDVRKEIENLETTPVELNLSIGYKSNIDLLDTYLWETRYTDNTVMNINANTSIANQFLGKELTYNTSLNSEFIYSDNYTKSSDFIRRSTFKNSFFLNLVDTSDILSLGPTLGLNAEKRYSWPGWYRKRDNISGFIGLKANVKPTTDLLISPEATVGYLDHNGNYVPQVPARFAYERDLEEDRLILKSNISTSYKINNFLTLSLPITFTRDLYKQRKARFAAFDDDRYHAMSIAQWTTETGQTFQDPKLEIDTFSSGLTANMAINEFYSFSAAYTYTDEREKNAGHRFSDTDQDNVKVSFLSSPHEKINISLDYENNDIRFYRLWGGGKEITQMYVSSLTLVKIISDINLVFSFSYTDYQITLPTGNTNNTTWQERASNSEASIGLITQL